MNEQTDSPFPRLGFELFVAATSDAMTSAAATLDGLDPSAPVLSCPGWPVSELRDHMAGVAVFWAEQLRTADADGDGPNFPPEIRERYKLPLLELRDDLIRALETAGPGGPCWNWSNAANTSDWAARRMAQEMTMHRCDVDVAAETSPLVIEPAIANDGINELIEVFADAPAAADLSGAPVIGLEAPGARWRLLASPEGVRPTDLEPVCSLSGSADQILLRLWHRPATLQVSGEGSVLDVWDGMAIFS